MHKCILCGTTDDMDSGDCWDGLCPSCADMVSEYMDHAGCSRAGAIEDLESDPWIGTHWPRWT